ncbi:hypothetical protein ACB098_02G022900 [Castanea mollissima]
MQGILGSVRQSLVFRTTGGGDDGGVGGSFGGFVEKIGSSIRKSRIGLFSQSPVRALPPPVPKSDDAPPIRWRRGELIGCGAFGRVYMGMNLDSGELLAVKQVSITMNSASKEKTQAHIRELEEEVKLLKNLSHPNIVRYLGTAREHDSLNILLEFVPGGSISSLLGKFGSFPESVIRMYTKQLLLGLEYLHKNGIMHRDIKGANILVDNKGCIKLADFGASKQVVELATINGAKSMKGTPYWMAPEVILQTGHSLEPDLRHVASDLLQHPFVTGDYWESHPLSTSVMESVSNIVTPGMNLKNSLNHVIRRSTCTGLKDVCEMDSLRISTVYPQNSLNLNVRSWGLSNPDDDMCQIDDKDDLMVGASVKLKSIIVSDDLNKSFNPMCEPTDDWPCKFDGSLESERSGIDLSTSQTIQNAAGSPGVPGKGENDFTFPCGPIGAEDDDEVTESKIRAFLDEKALELKKLQTPLYKFYSTMNAAGLPGAVQMAQSENALNILNLPPKSRSPNRTPTRRLSVVHSTHNAIPGNHAKNQSNASGLHDRALQEIQPPQQSEWKELLLDAQQESFNPSDSFSERQRKWKEELDEELKRNREMMRQAGAGGKTTSPNNCILTRQRERLRFAFSGK